MVKWADYKSEAKARGALAMELFVVRTTPVADPNAVKAALPEHLAYQRQLEQEQSLVLAGPISDATGEEMQGAGMIIYRASSLEAARALAEADPMHRSGAREFTLTRWLVNEGSLNFSLGLSTGRVALS